MLVYTQGSFVYSPNQRDTTLQCNVVSHWQDAYTKLFLYPGVVRQNFGLCCKMAMNTNRYSCKATECDIQHGYCDTAFGCGEIIEAIVFITFPIKLFRH